MLTQVSRRDNDMNHARTRRLNAMSTQVCRDGDAWHDGCEIGINAMSTQGTGGDGYKCNVHAGH
jgi:hypothetical protein